jgi:hypothetical protein
VPSHTLITLSCNTELQEHVASQVKGSLQSIQHTAGGQARVQRVTHGMCAMHTAASAVS